MRLAFTGPEVSSSSRWLGDRTTMVRLHLFGLPRRCQRSERNCDGSRAEGPPPLFETSLLNPDADVGALKLKRPLFLFLGEL